jgi:hypothetical protein
MDINFFMMFMTIGAVALFSGLADLVALGTLSDHLTAIAATGLAATILVAAIMIGIWSHNPTFFTDMMHAMGIDVDAKTIIP